MRVKGHRVHCANGVGCVRCRPVRGVPLPTTIPTTKQRIGAQMELRKATRYPVNAPALYSWEGADGTLQESQGITLDICDRGVFILAKEVPPVGKCVELDVRLPAVAGTARAALLHGEGTVVRTSGRGTKESGFAAAVVFQTESSDAATVLGSRRVQWRVQ